MKRHDLVGEVRATATVRVTVTVNVGGISAPMEQAAEAEFDGVVKDFGPWTEEVSAALDAFGERFAKAMDAATGPVPEIGSAP